MNIVLVTAAIVLLVPGASAALHLTLLTVASFFYRDPAVKGPAPHVRFRVLVPAHNEEAVIGDTLDVVTQDLRSGDCVTVVADGCTDRTAEIARAHGADVLGRGSTRLAGRAAARQSAVDYALGNDDWDAMVMIDADSRIEPGFFAACERMLATGALALQARSEGALTPGLISQAYVAAFALQGVTIPRGRNVLGLSARLRGTGMVISREVVEQYRFHSPASEDLYYSLDLCLDGIVPRHVDNARLRSESVRSWQAASGQRLRYEAGRMSAAREYLWQLIRRHSWASLEAAWHLATPPLAVAVGFILTGGILGVLGALAGGSWAVAIVAGGLLTAYAFDLCVALLQARAGIGTWLALLAAPWYVPWKMWIQFKAFASVKRGQREYGPTPRM